METECQIVSGPGVFNLSIALFRGKTISDDVVFEVTNLANVNKSFLHCTITSAKAQDWRRNSWEIEGSIEKSQPEKFDRSTKFKAHYDSQKRNGHMTVFQE